MTRNGQKGINWSLVVLILFLIGNVLTVVSLAAEILGLDLTPGFGVVQMLQLLVGLTLLTLAGFIHIYTLRGPNTPRSLQADIGIRLAATGLVFAYIAGLADLLGIGTHVDPEFARPYVGPLQLGGLVLGIISITAGMILYHTSRGSREHSSLEFLLNGGQEEEQAVEAEPAGDAPQNRAEAEQVREQTSGAAAAEG